MGEEIKKNLKIQDKINDINCLISCINEDGKAEIEDISKVISLQGDLISTLIEELDSVSAIQKENLKFIFELQKEITTGKQLDDGSILTKFSKEKVEFLNNIMLDAIRLKIFG